jgi:hypothetical protein
VKPLCALYEKHLVINVVRIAIIPTIAFLGTGFLYARFPAQILAVVRFAMFFLLAIVAVLVVTGVFISPGSGIHRVAGHAFIIVLWLVAPAATGVSVSEAIRSRRWFRLLHSAEVLFLACAGILSSFTGYLSLGSEASAEAHLRFMVLHQITSPFFLASLVMTWLFLSRRYADPGA